MAEDDRFPIFSGTYRGSRFPGFVGGRIDPETGNLALNASSPRVRGTRALERRFAKERRFIPACAGNTNWTPRAWIGSTVHPRVCGEHFPVQAPASAGCGSSPRVRGTPGRLNESDGV